MTFERVAPQVVRSAEGWTVQIGDRYHVEYLENDRVAKVKADLDGPTVRLYGTSAKWTKPSDQRLTIDERDLVITRVRAGLLAMGDPSEVVEE
jgi:hypothetical protein